MSEAGESRATPDPVVVVDVGARWGAADAWRALAPGVRVYGFDPDPEECARLNELAARAGDETTTYIPIALGPRHETMRLHVTRQPACSSIYPPLTALIEQIPVLADIEIDHTEPVALEPFDVWASANGVGRVDVLKVDTQGSELGVLQGAERALRTCLLVVCEVEFNPIYEGQPLFGDVDAFLRAQGFVLWRLDNLMHYTDDDVLPRLEGRVTVNSDARATDVRIGGGQLYWADATWVRADLLAPGLDPAVAARAARIAPVAGFADLAVRIDPASGPGLLAEAQAARRAHRAARRAAAPPKRDRPAPGPPPPSPLRRVRALVRRLVS